MSDITNVKRELASRALSVASMLLPGGKKEGSEYRAGSTGGGEGQSLGVHLSGEKSGVWQDFSTGEGGDLLDLWMATKGISLPQALEQARDYVGLTAPAPYREPRREYQRPPVPKGKAIEGDALVYMVATRRIGSETLLRYKVACQGTNIIFPFVLPDRTLAMVKTREAIDGAKPKPTSAGCEPVLFGWQAVPENAREVVICEGEIDALSWGEYGYNGMSVPFGGGKGAKQAWIEAEFERLGRFERIYVAMDMDKPGQEATAEIVSRLGQHRCYVISLPHKDINECLVADVPKSAIDALVSGAKTMDPEGLASPSSFADDVVGLFWPTDDAPQGYTTPYGKLGDRVVFRPAEVTLWSGASGMGKSQILSDCIPWWIKHGSRICLASFEMKGSQTLKRMVKQTTGLDRPTDEFIRKSLYWLDAGVILYEKVGKSGVQPLLEIFEYARAKYGCDQFIIDSLMRLGIAGDDYTGQEKAMFMIVDWAIKNNVHVHLVAHARKGLPGSGPPETEDVKGAMEIGANAFNILSVWRNRRHEEEMAMCRDPLELAELEKKPGVILNISKQRNGDYEGKIGLWFDQSNYRYHSSHEKGTWPRRYLP